MDPMLSTRRAFLRLLVLAAGAAPVRALAQDALVVEDWHALTVGATGVPPTISPW